MNEPLNNEQETEIPAAEAPAAAEAPSDPVEAALASAQARLAAEDSVESDATDEQAAGDGVSTQEKGATEEAEGEDGAGEVDATRETEQGDDALVAPSDWPQDWQANFDSLPDEGKGLALKMHNDLQSGFTRAMQRVADERRSNAELFDSMEQANATPADVASLLETAIQFETDPKGTLRLLAGRKNIDLFFEPQAPAGEIPEFSTQAEMAAWLSEQNEKRLDARLAQKEAEHAEKLKASEAKAKLRNELEEAAKLPGFAQLRDGVMVRLGNTPGLSVSDAYRLERFSAIEAEASQAGKLKARVAELEGQLEAAAKKVTSPPAAEELDTGKAPSSGDAVTDAFNRAKARIAATG